MARHATGPNDHPCAATFLQVYKVLSMYSILKPPKTGNCKILDSNTDKITITDLKNIFNENNSTSQRKEKNNILHNRIDSMIEEDTEIDDIFDNNIHNYYKAKVEDCVIYYICGFITKHLTKKMNCDACLKIIKGEQNYCNRPEAALVNLKSRGALTHPNHFIFNLLFSVEQSLSKYYYNPDVFLLTIDDFINSTNTVLRFQCKDHKNKVLTYIIIHYITVRMRQYSLISNKDQNKVNAKKKKCSKLVNS